MISWSTWWARLSCRAARCCRWAHWLWSWWPAKLCCSRSELSCWRAWTRDGRPGGTSPGKSRAPSTKWWLNHRSCTVTPTPRKCTTILTHQRTRSNICSRPVPETTTADIRYSHIDGRQRHCSCSADKRHNIINYHYYLFIYYFYHHHYDITIMSVNIVVIIYSDYVLQKMLLMVKMASQNWS